MIEHYFGITERKRIEEALRESEERYRALFEQAADSIVLIDAENGELVDFNEKAHKNLGFTHKEFKKLKIPDFEILEDADEVVNHNMKIVKEGADTFETKHRTKSGEIRDILVSSRAISIGGKNFIQSIWQDISNLKRAEEETREIKDHLDNIIESSLDFIVVSDNKGYITRVNKSFLKLTGYNKEEIIGKQVTEIAPTKGGTYESTTGELVEIDEAFFNDAKKMIYIVLFEEGKISNWETYLVRKDRKVIPAEENIVFLYNKEGDINGAVGIIREITERRKTEKEIKEARDFLENIFRTSVDGIIVTAKGLITMVNTAVEEMLGYSSGELIGKHVSLLSPKGKEYEEKAMTFVSELSEKGVVAGFEHAWLRKDGNLVDVEMNAALLKNDEGSITGSVGSIRDITERNQAEEEIKKSRESLQDLTWHLQSIREEERTGIAREIHDDLGQTLTALKMDLSWLNLKLPQHQTVLVEKVNSMSRSIDGMIKTIQRISAELRPSLLDNLGLVPAIEWHVKEFRKRTGLICNLIVDPKDITLDKDLSTTIFRILQETLTNVARHAYATRIEISLKKDDSMGVLEMRDNGKGITTEQISNPQSFGLIGIRERARFWEGEVTISGIQSKGTTVKVSIPLGRERKAH